MNANIKMNGATMTIIVMAMVALGTWVNSLKSHPVAQPPASNFYLNRLVGALAKPLDDLTSSKELQRAGETVANGISDAITAAAKEEKKKGEKK